MIGHSFRGKPFMTLQQVAERAGVSTSTVSRVINSMPGITAATAETVRRAMRELSYTPPLRRRSTANPQPSRTFRVGFVVLDPSAGQSHVPAYDYLLRGVSAAAGKFGIDLQVMFESDADAAVRRLAGSGFDGLVLHGQFQSLEQSRPLHGIPTVWLMGNRRRPIWGDQIMPDNAAIGQIAARYLLGHGHRCVACFGLFTAWWVAIRTLAFQQTVEDAGATTTLITPGLSAFDRLQAEDTENALRELIDTYRAASEKPTGLFIAEDWLVRPVFHEFRLAGIPIGREAGLDVISCNNDRAHLAGVDPMPATIDIHFEALGYRALEQLFTRLTTLGPDERVRIMVEPTLVPATPATA